VSARRAGVLALSLSLMLGACGGGADAGDVTGTLPAPASVRITAPATQLYVGQTVQLNAQALNAEGGDLAAGDAKWSSSNRAVAQVGETGLLMALTPGAATLTATIAGKSGTVLFSVEDLPSLDVTVQVTTQFLPATITVRRGGTVRFVFSGSQQNITFGTAFAGAPTNIVNTTTGTVARAFFTLGDFRYESTLNPGVVGVVQVR